MTAESDSKLGWMINGFGEQTLYEVNRHAFDKLGSTAVFQRHFGEGLNKPDSLFIIVGTDSGLLPAWLFQQYENDLPDGSRYLFVELPAVLAELSDEQKAFAEHPRVALATLEEWLELKESFQFRDYAFLENIQVLGSIGALDAYLPEYRPLQREVEQAIHQFTWQTSAQLGSEAFASCQIHNIAENRLWAKRLQGRFSGRTAVLLGGGPSLDEMLPWVQQHRERLTLIAVSRISRRLQQIGLIPDIVVTIDPHPVSFDVSKEMLRFPPETLLVCSNHVVPTLLSQWRGPAVYFASRYPWGGHDDTGNLPTRGPTVTNVALIIAMEMGFGQIILSGVDLCYSREGHTHAQGSNERQTGPMLGSEDIKVETNGGWLADTRHSFVRAAEIINLQAEQAKETGCRIINPAAGAARMQHVEHVPMDQLDIPQSEQSAADTIAACLPIDDLADRKRHYEAASKELARVNGRLRSMAKLADEGLECNDGLFGRNGKTADFKYKKRMDKIERRLDRDFEDLAPLVKNFGSRRFLRLVRPDSEREWSDRELEDWGRAYYESYKASTDKLLEMVESCQERVRARQQELAEQPNIDQLLAQWEKDDSPGRAAILLDQRSELELEPEELARLRQAMQQLEATLDEHDTRQAQWCREQYTLGPLRSKLMLLFRHEEQDELQRIISELENLEGDEAQELLFLAIGYRSELQDNQGQAMAAYNAIVDSAGEALGTDEQYRNPRLEDALRRMSAITLAQGDADNALLVLDALTSLAPVHAPQYAELLRLTGNLKPALDVLTDYLKRAPNDLSSMLRLGKLYQQAGVLDSARWAYDYILQEDPDNAAARQLMNEIEDMAKTQ